MVRESKFRVLMTALIATLMLGGVACSNSSNKRVAERDFSGVALPLGEDSLAYIIGLNIAEQLYKMDSSINVEVVCRAIMDKRESKPILSNEQAREYYLRYMLYVNPERRRSYEEKFLADLAINSREFTRTKSGLTYNISVIGDESLIPRGNNDWLTIKYSISRVGGESIVADTLMSEALPSLLTGLTESVKLIGKGGRIKAWIPSKLAYGEEGNEELGIEPIETLLFDIELVDLERNVAAMERRKQKAENF